MSENSRRQNLPKFRVRKKKYQTQVSRPRNTQESSPSSVRDGPPNLGARSATSSSARTTTPLLKTWSSGASTTASSLACHAQRRKIPVSNKEAARYSVDRCSFASMLVEGDNIGLLFSAARGWGFARKIADN